MRIQCPECGILRPASADPCPSCGAEAPASGETRGESGTSLRQWKQRYQTGQLPGISPGASGIGSSRQFPRRASGPLTAGSGQSNPDWGGESPSNSIPPRPSRSLRPSGPLTPPPDMPPTRQSGSISSSLWQRATDPTPPPPSRTSGTLGNPGRSSGMLSNPGRSSGSEAGNTSTSWQWRGQGTTGSGFPQQMDDGGYDGQDGYENDDMEAMPPQASGRFRSGSMLPVPYQNPQRGWNQSDEYDELDEAGGSSARLPATMGRQNSMAFPMMDDSMLQQLAPGRKPPAFIPATRQRRPYRLSRYRILSGTISLALVVMLAVGALGFLVVHFGLANRFLGSTPLAAHNYSPQQSPIPTLSGTPQATPSGNPAAQVITNVVTALHYSSSFDPINPSTTFQTGQNVNVLWKVKTAKVNDVVSVIWYLNGGAVTVSSTPNTQKVFDKPGAFNGLFALCYPQGGLGKAELYWNGQLAQSIEFVVRGNQASCANS